MMSTLSNAEKSNEGPRSACLCFVLSFVHLICYSCVLNFYITCIEKIKQSVLFLLSLFHYQFNRNSVTTVMLQNVLLKH